MKRTIYLAVYLIAVFLLYSFYLNTESSALNETTCCQKFHVQDVSGNPVEGCTISLPDGSYCVTDEKGNCEICGLTGGAEYTAVTACPDSHNDGTVFYACIDASVILIIVR